MSTNEENEQIVLAEHPSGIPTENTFRTETIEMPGLDGVEVLLRSLYVSVDPGMRGFMDEGDDDAAGSKFALDQPITSRTVAEVLESGDERFEAGDIVQGRLAWKRFQAASPDALVRVDPDIAPISTSVSLLGVPGLAAYFGMLKIGNPRPGETVVVSGAAGSVGSVASQIARIRGCRVVGIAGSSKKIEYLERDLGLDKGIDYKETDDMEAALREACPDGVDVFFDNVGGEIFDAVLANINEHARIAVCGQIAEYNASDPPRGPRPMHALIKHSARIEGYVVFDFEEEFDEAKKRLGEWFDNGELKYRENVIEGFENIPSAFIGLFSGENIGKQIVKVAERSASSDGA